MSVPTTSFDPSDDLRIFRMDEVAARLGISVDNVQRLLDRGELTTVRPRKRGRVVQIPAASLRDYIYGDGVA